MLWSREKCAKIILQNEKYYVILSKAVNSIILKGGNMAAKAKAAKKAKCASKTKEGKKCKNNASGKSKFCAAHKKK